MWLIKRPQIILAILEFPFLFTISDNVPNFSLTPCVFIISDVWCTVHIKFLYSCSSLGPVIRYTRSCLEKLGKGILSKKSQMTLRNCFVYGSRMTVSNENLPTEQCAVLRTVCLYTCIHPDCLLHLRIVAIFSVSRRTIRVMAGRVAARSLWGTC